MTTRATSSETIMDDVIAGFTNIAMILDLPITDRYINTLCNSLDTHGLPAMVVSIIRLRMMDVIPTSTDTARTQN